MGIEDFGQSKGRRSKRFPFFLVPCEEIIKFIFLWSANQSCCELITATDYTKRQDMKLLIKGAHFPALAAGEAGAPVGASVRPRIETENGTFDVTFDITCEAGNVTCQRYT